MAQKREIFDHVKELTTRIRQRSKRWPPTAASSFPTFESQLVLSCTQESENLLTLSHHESHELLVDYSCTSRGL